MENSASSGHYTRTSETQSAVERYMRGGISVIPVAEGEKNPNRPGWQRERHTIEDVPKLWNNGQGVGVLWGAPSDGRVDIDCDWPEAAAAASFIAPETRTFGRPGSPASHFVLHATGTIPKTKRYKLPGEGDDNAVVELLSTGTQSLVPPSLHDSGERRRWYQERGTALVDGAEVAAIAADIATAALLTRNYPGKGARHDYIMAGAGYIGRHLPRKRAERVMYAVIRASGDEEAAKRRADVQDTLDKIQRDEPTTGGPTLDELAPGIVKQLRRWHGWGGEHIRPATQEKTDPSSGVGIIKMLADAITAEDHFAQDAGGKLYRYSGGIYKHHAERYIRRRVKEILEDLEASEKWSSHRANEVVEYIRADAPELWERPPLNEVNVLNGILDVETKRLRDHDPDFMSRVQIPVRYDPAATCPAWEQFVSETFPQDAQDLAFEMPADVITPSRSVQKSILLIGEGSNGKSTYLQALTAFVGRPNTAGVSLHKLESDRFATARLIGKLANICPDLPSTHLTETSAFKAITGGDDLGAEYKYREAFEFRPYCRLVFSANHAPRSGDASHAFFRRWLVVPFERTFEPVEQLPREELDAKLSDPKELSGVLNRALDVLPRVRREGFTESPSMREAWEEFRGMTDPVTVWLQQNTTEAAEAFVPKDALATAYNKFCDKAGRPGMNKKGFGRAVKRAFPHIEDGQKSVAGKMTWCWLGIGLRSGDDNPTTHTTHGTNENPSTCFENEIPPKKQESGNSQKTNKENSVSSVSSVSAEQEQRIRKRVEEGMSERLAREEVLGKGWVEP